MKCVKCGSSAVSERPERTARVSPVPLPRLRQAVQRARRDRVESGASGVLEENDLRLGGYDCVLINLDQNRSEWRNYGLKLAQTASQLGILVVMIPDHDIAAKTIDANGWLRVNKPFTPSRACRM